MIDTTNKKLAVMEMDDYWEPGLPISPSTLGQDDQQQLLWGYPGILWAAGAALAFILDMNTRLFAYLASQYTLTSDNTSMVRRNLDGQASGDANQRLKSLIDTATAAMS